MCNSGLQKTSFQHRHNHQTNGTIQVNKKIKTDQSQPLKVTQAYKIIEKPINRFHHFN